jgi:hypothetical protein
MFLLLVGSKDVDTHGVDRNLPDMFFGSMKILVKSSQ